MKITMNVHLLIPALKFAREFAAVNDTRYMLNGVYFTATKDNLELVATDGHRLGHITTDVPIPDDFQSFILPLETVNIMLKTKPRKSDDYQVSLEITGRDCTISMDFQSINCQLIDGNYIDWESVVQAARNADRSDSVKDIGVNAGYLADALKASTHVGDPKYKGIALTFDGPKNPVIIDIVSPDYSDVYALVMPMFL